VRRFGQPPVIGELAAGIAIGPSVLGALAPEFAAALFTPTVTAAIRQIATLAILVFMFLVGLELDTARLRQHATGVLRIASVSLLVPFTLGSVVAFLLYPSWHGAVANRTAFILFGGTAMSITAMPVLTRILVDLRMLTTTIGTVAVGCAAIDDVVAWTMLGFVVSLTRGEGNLAMALGLTVAYVGGMLLVVRPLLAMAVTLRDRPGGRAGWIVLVIAVAVLSAIAAERIGVHAVFGALVAGVCLPRRPQVLEGLEGPLRLITTPLLPAFFILIGLRTEIGLMPGASAWALTAGIIACATAGKLGGSALAARTAGFVWRDALIIGSLLNTRGLVELVALDIGRQLGILSPVLFTMFVIMTFVTTLATVPLIGWLGVSAEADGQQATGTGHQAFGRDAKGL
jgi:Kef-type K+ transport system membrane component KefB